MENRRVENKRSSSVEAGPTADDRRKMKEELKEIAKSDSIINKAIKELDRLSQDEETRPQYRYRMLAESDRASALLRAEQRGKAEGKIEGKKETARMALRAGVSLETISQITGLDQATIRKLKGEQEQYNKE
jgi:predicted transposase/invertase (TIGR01784 family)